MNNTNVEIGTLIFNNGPPFRTLESRDMADIILKARNVLREYKIPSREKIRGKILDACYDTMRERHTWDLLN